MAQVTLTVSGQSYDVACEDGQEGRLRKLAAYIDDKMSVLSGDLGRVADSRLFLLTALVLADELFEIRDKAAKDDSRGEKKLAHALDGVARRIEDIAVRLEAS